MDKDKKVYEEPEIVQDSEVKGKTRGRVEDAAVNFGKESVEELRSKLFWAGFGSLFVFLLVVFLVLGLIITILFWLLPFALAAALVAFIIVGVGSGIQGIRKLFGK